MQSFCTHLTPASSALATASWCITPSCSHRYRMSSRITSSTIGGHVLGSTKHIHQIDPPVSLQLPAASARRDPGSTVMSEHRSSARGLLAARGSRAQPDTCPIWWLARHVLSLMPTTAMVFAVVSISSITDHSSVRLREFDSFLVDRIAAITSYTSNRRLSAAATAVPRRLANRYPRRNGSRYPSSTLSTSPTSTLVRWSLAMR